MRLKDEIEWWIHQGYTVFTSGITLGVSTYAAETVLELRRRHPDIILEAVLPCANQRPKWRTYHQEQRYKQILYQCDVVTYIEPEYGSYGVLTHNCYMVDNTDLLIAVYDNLTGAAGAAIRYAQQRDIDIVLIDPLQ